MGFAPGLHALDVVGATEVVRVLRAGRPALLVGAMPGLLAGRFRAGVLMMPVTGVRSIQTPAMTALASSMLLHPRSMATTPCPMAGKRRSTDKQRGGRRRKKILKIEMIEEEPKRKCSVFKPPVLDHFHFGVHILHPFADQAAALSRVLMPMASAVCFRSQACRRHQRLRLHAAPMK